MITLGLNVAFHDSAAALVIDGVTVAAAEEERFTRIRHARRAMPFPAWELPFHAIDACLAQANIHLRDVDHVACSLDPDALACDEILPADTLGGPWDPLFLAHAVNAPRQLADGAPHHLRKRLGGICPGNESYRWHFVNHHTAHQASAFLASPFSHCAVMTLGGRGERATTTYGVYRDGRYDSLGAVEMPNSLGLLYAQVTTHLGFCHSSDEYKVMALAALGTPHFRDTLRAHVEVLPNGKFTLMPIDLAALFGPARAPGSPMEEHHLDLAASLQDVLEDTVLQLASWLREVSAQRRLVMAGGVALNCVMNSRLRDSGIFDAVWVQPAAGDAGTALGAALWVDARERAGPAPAALTAPATAERPLAARCWEMTHACLGPAYADEEVESLLRWAKLPYRRLNDIARDTAALLAAEKIVGWFQGRMEFGPRALGARSILASPINLAMQARLNELKGREDFRPMAPAVPAEELGHWFAPPDANGGVSPFMLFVYDVVPGREQRIPAACHTDRTARVQTVDRETQPRFHALLTAFGQLTGVPVLVNTSFNVRGEPMVCSPRDALRVFFSSPLDALVMGPFLIEKTESGGVRTA